MAAIYENTIDCCWIGFSFPLMKSPQRIARLLRDELRTCPPQRRMPVIVTLAPEPKSVADLGHLAAELPIRRTFQTLPAASLQASPSEVRRLATDGRISRVWLDLPCHAWIDRSSKAVNAPFAWRSGWTGQGVLVGVIDTGIDENHPDLAGRIVAQRDFIGEGVGDFHGHGTHVAGIIAGSGAASGGKYKGISPDASLLVAKALGSDGVGLTSQIMAAMEWLVSQGVRIINLSLGLEGPTDGTDPLSLAIDAAHAYGCLVVVAAGNSGPDRGSLGVPAGARRGLAVGAVDRHGHVYNLSSRGPTADGRNKPDLAAPGTGIISCCSAHSPDPVIDQHYTASTGTSMAAPHVAGAAALVLEANPNMSVDELAGALLNTAPLESSDPNEVGRGLLMIDQALTGDPSTALPPAERDGCLASLVPGLTNTSASIWGPAAQPVDYDTCVGRRYCLESSASIRNVLPSCTASYCRAFVLLNASFSPRPKSSYGFPSALLMTTNHLPSRNAQ